MNGIGTLGYVEAGFRYHLAGIYAPKPREVVFREMKMRAHYEKPSEKRVREKAEAIRRARKLARKRAQREGLIPGPRKQADTARPARSA